MRISLAADFHLDKRQFNRQQRWVDYVNTFAKVTKKTKELAPDVFVIAGDLFDKYRPHPWVIRRFLKEINSLDCPVILIRGNHDSPQVFFERFGGDILHLLRDVSEIVYLNKDTPAYEIDDVCFIGVGYISVNPAEEIAKRVRNVKTEMKTKIGIFHQMLDYPGVSENQVEVSRGFLKGLGFNYVLMGHWHSRYEEKGLFSPGSPEYWSFDQGQQIHLNLDTGEEKTTVQKEKGFYLIDTANNNADFIQIEPARPMYCITYETASFNETKFLPIIRNHIEKYNVEGAMVKTSIQGRCRYGRISLASKITLDKPLIHTVLTNLKPSDMVIEKTDIIEAQTTYLRERGLSKEVARKISEWLEHNKEDLNLMQSKEMLNSLRTVLKSKEKKQNKPNHTKQATQSQEP